VKRPKFGDILEIPLTKGFAYAQYTHRHPTHGGLLRVLDGIFTEPIRDENHLTRLPVRFTTFFPVGAAVNRGILTIVCRAAIRPEFRGFPVFRMSAGGDSNWWLWDGEKEWKVGRLSPEQRRLPIASIWNGGMLVHRIESGWRQEDE
jgi:hypothetical protein